MFNRKKVGRFLAFVIEIENVYRHFPNHTFDDNHSRKEKKKILRRSFEVNIKWDQEFISYQNIHIQLIRIRFTLKCHMHGNLIKLNVQEFHHFLFYQQNKRKEKLTKIR